MTARKSIEVGQIYSIPLFVSELPSTARLKKQDLEGGDKQFAFMRVISVDHGVLVEVFSFVGSLDASIATVALAPRLFPPVMVSSVPITKGRWRLVGSTPGYDPERHSKYSEVTLVLGTADHPILWRAGDKTEITQAEAKKHERWEVWRAHHLERRILRALGR